MVTGNAVGFVLLLPRNKKKEKKRRDVNLAIPNFARNELQRRRSLVELTLRGPSKGRRTSDARAAGVAAEAAFEAFARRRRGSRGPLSPSLDAGKGSPPLADRRCPPTRRSLRREDGQSRRGSRRWRRKKIAIIAQHFLYIGCVAVTWLNLSV